MYDTQNQLGVQISGVKMAGNEQSLIKGVVLVVVALIFLLLQ